MSRETYLFAIVFLGMIFVYIFAHGNSSEGIWTVGYARGLITLTFSVGTMVIAVILTLTSVLRDPDDDDARAKARFDRAKDVLTLLIGVFGTIIGFYFGTLNDTRQPPRAGTAPARAGRGSAGRVCLPDWNELYGR